MEEKYLYRNAFKIYFRRSGIVPPPLYETPIGISKFKTKNLTKLLDRVIYVFAKYS